MELAATVYTRRVVGVGRRNNPVEFERAKAEEVRHQLLLGDLPLSPRSKLKLKVMKPYERVDMLSFSSNWELWLLCGDMSEFGLLALGLLTSPLAF